MAENTAVYIGKLVLEDFKSFKGRNELDLMDDNGHLYQWTVFLGNNNTGKTNLLKAIADLEPMVFSRTNTKDEINYVPLNFERDRESRFLTNRQNDGEKCYFGSTLLIDNLVSGLSDTNDILILKDNFFNRALDFLEDNWYYNPENSWRAAKDNF